MRHFNVATKSKRLETDFKHLVCSGLAARGFHITQHEPGKGSDLGVPDLSYGILGINGWIEIKFGDNHYLRTTQTHFLNKRSETGGNCFVLWGFENEMILFDWQQWTMISLPLGSWESLAVRLMSGYRHQDHVAREKMHGKFTFIKLRKMFNLKV